MKKYFAFLLFVIFNISLYSQDDCKAPDYLTQMKGFDLASCQFSEFNEYEFHYNDINGKTKQLKKSGAYYRLNYEKNENENRQISGVQVRTNYYNAVIKGKGENLSIDKNFYRFSNNGKNIYLLVDNAWDDSDFGYQIHIIEEGQLEQEITLDIAEGIKKDGKIALYGIFFDIDKATIKKESEPELKTLIDYLNNNMSVNIFIVGHTDMSGNIEHNVKLSKARASSVKDYLVTNGKINTNRISTDGVGPLCPVSTNENESGRKLNRRVEVVKK